MLLPLLPESFVAMIGAQTAGMANPINFLWSRSRSSRCCARRVAACCSPPIPPSCRACGRRSRRHSPAGPTPPCCFRRLGGPPGPQSFETELDRQPADALTFTRAIGPADVASLFHTGGTTALPKLARHTHGGLALQCWANAQMQDLREDDVWLTGVPAFHVGGANCAGLTAAEPGRDDVLLTPAGFRNPNVVRNVWALVERFRATVLGMVPTSWGAALNVAQRRLRSSPASASCALRRFNVARWRSSHAVARRLGRPIREGWGMTELHGYATMTPAKRSAGRLHRAARALH